ncbi:MAG TPA: tRNA guanosine(34) transglycosylase Tgt [Acidobacteriota bacterium]|jgi:queuine tRNA-ribosyltransferase
MPFFDFLTADSQSRARLGRLTLAHGTVETPVFMPVGTAATVKALPHEYLESFGTQIILANTYHLYLRPGDELIAALGGLHKFMSWHFPILTDSGGFQIFSQRELISTADEGAWFSSHLDGSKHFFTPEKSMQVQRNLGADIMMVLDECTSYPATYFEAAQSLALTLRWARRCKEYCRLHPAYPSGEAASGAGAERSMALDLTEPLSEPALFGIVQGSIYADLRAQSMDILQELDFPGYGIGGLGVGEPKQVMYEVTAQCGELLPMHAPRYLMGIGTPADLLHCVALGIDMFDCVLPTRNARNGYLFTSKGRLSIKNARHAGDSRPVDEECVCPVCRRYSRAYLRHLFMAGEILSSVYNTVHNVYFYLNLMAQIRQSIAARRFTEFKQHFLSNYNAGI